MKPYTELGANIRDAVRKKAQEIPEFKNKGDGVIRIFAYPASKEADVWLGGLSTFDGSSKPDVACYELSFSITPGGSYIMTGVWDGVKQQVDCYAYSALKIADCVRSRCEMRGMMSGLVTNDPYRREDNGYGPYKGALCFEVYGYPRERFCYVIVCVSGAENDDDDLECVKAAIDVVKDFFENNDNGFFFFSVLYPFF